MVFSWIALAAAQPARQFRAGAATSNITPWLGVSSNGGMQDRVPQHVHDELHARAVVLDDGRTRLALVTVDSCMVPREIFDAAKKRVHQHSDRGRESRLISAPPPSEPDVRISRIRLSSRWFYLRED